MLTDTIVVRLLDTSQIRFWRCFCDSQGSQKLHVWYMFKDRFTFQCIVSLPNFSESSVF